MGRVVRVEGGVAGQVGPDGASPRVWGGVAGRVPPCPPAYPVGRLVG